MKPSRLNKTAFRAGYRAAQAGKPRLAPYVPAVYENRHERRSWYAGYDHGFSK